MPDQTKECPWCHQEAKLQLVTDVADDYVLGPMPIVQTCYHCDNCGNGLELWPEDRPPLPVAHKRFREKYGLANDAQLEEYRRLRLDYLEFRRIEANLEFMRTYKERHGLYAALAKSAAECNPQTPEEAECPAETNEDAPQGSEATAIEGYPAYYDHDNVSVSFHLSEESFEWLYREHLRTGLEPDDIAANLLEHACRNEEEVLGPSKHWEELSPISRSYRNKVNRFLLDPGLLEEWRNEFGSWKLADDPNAEEGRSAKCQEPTTSADEETASNPHATTGFEINLDNPNLVLAKTSEDGAVLVPRDWFDDEYPEPCR